MITNACIHFGTGPGIRRIAESRWGRGGLLLAAFLFMAIHLHTRLYMSQIEQLEARWDYHVYYQMASHKGLTPVLAPYAYRWIPHRLVAYVPLSPKRIYEVINLLGFWLTAWVLAEWLVRLGFAVRYVLPVVVVGFTWSMFGGVFYLWGRFPTEPLGYLALVLGIYAVHFSSFWTVLLLTAVGVLCREQALLLIVYFYLVRYGARLTGPGILATLTLAVIPVGLFIFVRVVTPTVGDYSYTHMLRTILTEKFDSFGNIFRVLASVFLHAGMVSGVIFLTARTSLKPLRLMPGLGFWLLANFFLGILGGLDTDRLAFYAFPAELYLLCALLTQARCDWADARWMMLGAIFTLGQVTLSGTFANGTFRPPNITPGWCTLSFFAFSIMLWLARGSVRPKPLPLPETEHGSQLNT